MNLADPLAEVIAPEAVVAAAEEPRAPCVLLWGFVILLLIAVVVGVVVTVMASFEADATSSAMKSRSAASYLSSGVVQSPSELPVPTYLPSPTSSREELEGTATAPTMVATLQVMCPLKNGPCRRIAH